MAEGNALIAALRAASPIDGQGPSGPVALAFPWQTNDAEMSRTPRTPTARPSSKSQPPVNPPTQPPPSSSSNDDPSADYRSPSLRWFLSDDWNDRPDFADPLLPVYRNGPANAVLTGTGTSKQVDNPDVLDPDIPSYPAKTGGTGADTNTGAGPVVQPPPPMPPGPDSWDDWDKLGTDPSKPGTGANPVMPTQPTQPTNPYAFNWDEIGYLGFDPSAFMVPGVTLAQQPAAPQPAPAQPVVEAPSYQPDVPWWYWDNQVLMP